ncbi:hypothetical protein HU200_048974 [Digitaria exilis]|uniref:Uncharacterized protein n=1 Tax=Digitaria exilis TaxID=1010633 RepID=A0A835AW00_9POAL|nr:hypothetical protein HU200_048974 [Digitaria exilis]
MEVVTGALPSIITKLTILATGEYNLQNGLKGEIKFLQEELTAMKGALEDVAKVPAEKLPNGDEIWARNVRELSYDIEDSIDKVMVKFEGRKLDNLHGFRKFIGSSLDWLMQPMVRHKIATEIKEIKSRLQEAINRLQYFIVIDDIWDINLWKIIKNALLDNDVGSMIVVTTRNRDVAEQVGGAYQMKPLSLSKSQKLLYARIFGTRNKNINEDMEKCLDEELAEVSNRILKKCAGVPLAIITIGSLLASKGANKMDWDEVYNSMGTGLYNNFDVGTMREILLLSYYDLPSYLKTCLLYLSVFPEDFNIERDRLIWMWVAEGFIQCTREGESLSEIGESYFNELINRSMIQLVNYEYDLENNEYCCVHDMVLELIRILSSKENFVTILHGHKDDTSPTNTVRRLSLQNWKVDHARIGGKTSKKKIRSVVVFSPLNPELKLWTFGILRVLDLESCRLYKVHFSLKHIGKLTHLRCLHIQSYGGVPRGISNLTSLEVLSIMLVGDSTTIIELGHLTELRVLKISLNTGYTVGLENSLVECLQKLKKINTVDIRGTDLIDRIGLLDAWQAPPHLRRIQLSKCWFSVRPDWMNPSHLRYLTFLGVSVLRLQQEDLAIIGRLPALRDLCLCVDYGLGIVVNGSLFPNLIRCKLLNFMPPVVFRHGAMPMLTDLEFTFAVRETRRITGSIDSLEFGLESLRALQNIIVRFGDESDREHDREEAMAINDDGMERRLLA